MDAGIISHRYAKAFYLFAVQRNEEDRLREELKILSEHFPSIPLLQKTLDDPTVAAAVKIDLLTTAAGKDISDTCRKVIHLLVKNKREHYIRPVALMYENVYKKAKGMVVMKLVTTEPVSSDVKNKLVDLIRKDHNQVEFATETDTDLIGGFILEIEDLRLDTSVRNMLNQLRLELVYS
jgi:ATP synthase, F1 delta subunit